MSVMSPMEDVNTLAITPMAVITVHVTMATQSALTIITVMVC